MASHQGMRAQIEGHWRDFDSLAEMQSRGNEAIIRAIDVFEGARGAFIAEQEARGAGAGAGAAPSMFGAHQWEGGWASGGGGGGGAGAAADDGGAAARRAYVRAEEGLALAREQLARNEETLQQMAEEVERARACINSFYNTDDVASREERREVRSRASLQALDRGDSGCAMTPVEMARAMAGLLRMHQSELEMQESIVYGLGYETSAESITGYREALGMRPYLDDQYRSQAQEIRDLSQELEQAGGLM
ncbi:unnamed protein product [Ectocarpus sp. CCAP 1310/34]|nr:unnamed protein product [Ectocarpus sp. CCAP 1310/34]